MIFDSCVLIDALNGHDDAMRLVQSDLGRTISVATRSEVLAGAGTPAAQRDANQFFDRFGMFTATAEIADEAGTIRRDSNLKLPDAIILATARLGGLALVTRDAQLARAAGTSPAYILA